MAVAYPELADHPRCLTGVRYPHPHLANTYQPGTTEPWIAQLVSSLLVASGGTNVLETGAFQGTTTAWLALTLERMGGGSLVACDIDGDRVAVVADRLTRLGLSDKTNWAVLESDVLAYLTTVADGSLDLVWLDDDHQQAHVAAEIEALWPKMRAGGLIVGHDVYGVCDLQAVFRAYGGYAIDLPRLGPAGGIGVIQCR